MDDKSKKSSETPLIYECEYCKKAYNTTKCVLRCNSPSCLDKKMKYLKEFYNQKYRHI
jgi:hypothetical protein